MADCTGSADASSSAGSSLSPTVSCSLPNRLSKQATSQEHPLPQRHAVNRQQLQIRRFDLDVHLAALHSPKNARSIVHARAKEPHPRRAASQLGYEQANIGDGMWAEARAGILRLARVAFNCWNN